MKPSEIRKSMDSSIAEIANDLSQYEGIRQMWENFFATHRGHKRYERELMGYFDNKTQQYMKDSFLLSIEEAAEEFYKNR